MKKSFTFLLMILAALIMAACSNPASSDSSDSTSTVAVTGVEITTIPSNYSFSGGTCTQMYIQCTITPSNATNQTVTWEISDPNIFTLEVYNTSTVKMVYNTSNTSTDDVILKVTTEDGSRIDTITFKP